MQAEESALQTIRTSPPSPQTGVAICVVRDELALLPHFLHHYRGLGVQRFAFVDNGSTDGTLQYLLGQVDCDVFHHPGNFRAASAGMAWKNLLLRAYAPARWYLSVDADEHLVYDGWPDQDIDSFADRLGRTRHRVATAILVDMYGPGPVLETHIRADRSLLEIFPLFDGEGYLISTPDDWKAQGFPQMNIRGGPLRRVMDDLQPLGWLAKSPLILEPGILFGNPHSVNPVELNFAAPHTALLHFRLSGDLPAKAVRVMDWQTYSPGSLSDYQRLHTRLLQDSGLSFAYPGSVQFNSPGQLVERGLICGASQPAFFEPVLARESRSNVPPLMRDGGPERW